MMVSGKLRVACCGRSGLRTCVASAVLRFSSHFSFSRSMTPFGRGKLEACTKGRMPLEKDHRLEAYGTSYRLEAQYSLKPMAQATGWKPAVQLEAHGTSYRHDACSTVLRTLWISDLQIGTEIDGAEVRQSITNTTTIAASLTTTTS